MKHILFLIIALFLFTSCKKEKKIERNLWKNGGKWEIVKYEEIVVSTWPANEKNEVVENAGIFQFKRDGTGWRIDRDDYFSQKLNFKYSNTSTELSLDYFEYGSSDTYVIDWEKNAMTLTQSGTKTYTPGSTNLVITDTRTYRYTCKKD